MIMSEGPGGYVPPPDMSRVNIPVPAPPPDPFRLRDAPEPEPITNVVRMIREAYWDELIRTAHRRAVTEPDIEDLQRAVEERFWTGTVRAEHALEEFRRAVTEPVPEYDELIASTRAEFPYDPLDYGRFGREQMAWSPPEDGQEVSRCPA